MRIRIAPKNSTAIPAHCSNSRGYRTYWFSTGSAVSNRKLSSNISVQERPSLFTLHYSLQLVNSFKTFNSFASTTAFVNFGHVLNSIDISNTSTLINQIW
jgi:hypothetical protein